MVKDPAALALLDGASAAGVSAAAQVGQDRARLQHVLALEMLRAQRAGQIAEAREWRSSITLPRYADGEENALLLQNVAPAQANQPAITKALAREDIGWQTARSRQLLDYLQEGLKRGDANAAFVEGLHERDPRARAVSRPPLLAAGGIAGRQPRGRDRSRR